MKPLEKKEFHYLNFIFGNLNYDKKKYNVRKYGPVWNSYLLECNII